MISIGNSVTGLRLNKRIKRAQRLSHAQDSHSLDRSLEVLESSHNYYSWIASGMGSKLKGRVLEVGAGSGTFTKVISTTAVAVDALEPSMNSFHALSDATKSMSNVTPIQGTLESLSERESGMYDSAVLVNVLEHIEDDRQCLIELARLVKPGGGLAIWVPAHEFLYSDFDFRLGHYRRYSLSELQGLVQNTGFRVDRILYRNAAGALAWWIVAKIGKREPTSRRLANLWDRTFMRATIGMESHVRFPFGQSLLLLASLPD